MDGREVLAHIKEDDDLKTIPDRHPDHFRGGSGYREELPAPGELLPQQARAAGAFESLVKSINDFWLTKVKLPQQRQANERDSQQLRRSIGIAWQRNHGGRSCDRIGEEAAHPGSPGRRQSGDVRLTQEAFRDANRSIHLHVATDGVEAMAFLRQRGSSRRCSSPGSDPARSEPPQEWMAAKSWRTSRRTTSLKTIPTVILTTSEAEADIVKSYQLQANCYLTKPVQLDAFENLVKSINDFWLTKVKLPQPARSNPMSKKLDQDASAGRRQPRRRPSAPRDVQRARPRTTPN